MSPAVLSNGNGHTDSHPVTKAPAYGFSTRAVHVGSEPDAATGAVIPAISLSTTYQQTAVGVHKGFEYSRSGNPNRDAFETTLASLESGGHYGLAFSSGSATTATVIQALGAGAHMISYVNGHADVVMGAAILPAHQSAFADRLRYLQNAIGAVPSPYDAWLAQRGAKTLGLRMRQHGLSALHIAKALEKSPHVAAVLYPGLATHPRNALAYASLSPHAKTWVDAVAPDRAQGFPFGGMVSFRIRGSAHKFLEATRLSNLYPFLNGISGPWAAAHLNVPATQIGTTSNSHSLPPCVIVPDYPKYAKLEASDSDSGRIEGSAGTEIP
ncbi:hypothetical protein FIBSPDRAFT_931977 [Athelia psychrophila]|uniref:cystathionine gamma-lyase n=1 Tax=Athelia psychrophila TaxID=1759441 RepID=A0A166JL90_9AGAM|nr:hypothetical protein FIBSPDRAFT_931977 [Fibularhizoctonia sp. CBS 109695]